MPKSRRALGWATAVACLVPLTYLLWRYGAGRLGYDPLETALKLSGRYALALLMASLVPSALRHLTGWRGLLPLRRTLGLAAFGYAALHAFLLLGVEYWGSWSLLWTTLAESPFILLGAAALFILTALAITSTRGWARRLGSRWRRLHRFTYVAAILAMTHYAWSAKELRLTPLLVGGALLLLLAARLVRLGDGGASGVD